MVRSRVFRRFAAGVTTSSLCLFLFFSLPTTAIAANIQTISSSSLGVGTKYTVGQNGVSNISLDKNTDTYTVTYSDGKSPVTSSADTWYIDYDGANNTWYKYNAADNKIYTSAFGVTYGSGMDDPSEIQAVKDTAGAVTSPSQTITSATQQATNAGIANAVAGIGDSLLKGAGKFFELLGYAIYWVANALLYIAAQILNASFEALVIKMGSYTNLWEAVKLGWKAIRDIGNTLFIFVLLYAAFNTVLGLKNGLDLVPRIIVVALLVNFSFLFASETINISNNLASKVYDELIKGAESGSGFSGKIVTLTGATSQMHLSISQADAKAALGASSANVLSGTTFDGFPFFIKAVFGSAFLFILSGFFLAIAFTLIARFVTLVVLCVVSSLAFLSYLLPTFRKQSDEWWSALIGQSFYAPAIFLMLLITTGLAEKLNKDSMSLTGTGSNVTDNFSAILSFGLAEFFKFCILVAFLYASMVLAKKISERGSSAAISVGQRAQRFAATAAFGGGAFALRGTLGRLGETISDSDWAKKNAVQGGIRGVLGRQLMGVGGRMQDSSFDFRKTGAAAAISAATGADYGKVSDLASKGRRGFVEARDKENNERVEAVRKTMDLSKDDKLKKIDELAAKAAGSSDLGRAHGQVTAGESALEVRQEILESERAALEAARASGSATAIARATGRVNSASADVDAAKTRLDAAKAAREEEGYKTLNKKLFGVNTAAGEKADRDINHSVVYAQGRRSDAQARSSGRRTALWAAGAVGAAAFAPLAAPAAAAVAAFSAGRAIHNTVTHIRGDNAARIRASEKHEKAYNKVADHRKTVERLDAEEKSRSAAFASAAAGARPGMLQGLTRAEETERRKAQAAIEKYENAGKKKED